MLKTSELNMKLVLAKFYAIHIIVTVIVVACFLMNGPMRGGLPVDNTFQERAQFIGDNNLIWSISWCVWMLSALGLFVFCAILADELKKTLLRTIGLSIVAMGIGPDLIAEVIYAFVIPKLIHGNVSMEILQVLESLSVHLTGFLGNGLYNIGGLMLTVIAIKEGLLKTWIAIWGVTAWVFGLLLSASVAVDAVKAMEIFTVCSMVLSTLWMLVFAYRVLKR